MVVTFEEHRRHHSAEIVRTRWFLRNAATARAGRLSIYESECIERTPDIEVTVYPPNGVPRRISGSDIPRTRSSDHPFMKYNRYVHELNAFRHTVFLSEYAPGTRIRVVEEREFERPQFLGRFALRERYPAVRRRLVLIWPSSLDLRAGIENAEGCSLQQTKSRGDECHVLVVSADTLEAVDRKASCAVPEQWFACLHVSFPPAGDTTVDWRSVGDHYLEFVGDALAPSDRAAEIAQAWSGLPPDSTVSAAFDYVRNTIRYYGDWRHIYAFVPRPADEVLGKAYGDCKEMAVVLMSLLRPLGLDVRLALVSTRGFFQPLEQYPTLGAFNHVIVAVRRDDGDMRYYDPTHVFASAANSYYHLIGRRVLILRGGASRLDSIGRTPDYTNEVITRSTVECDDRGSWQLHGTIVMKGHSALDWKTEANTNVYVSEEGMRREYLKERFGLATTWSTVSAANDTSVTVEYRADFGEHAIGGRNAVLVLDVPRPVVSASPFADPSYEGPRYLPGLVQRDYWKVPTTHTVLSSKQLDKLCATGSWDTRGGVIRRTIRITPSLIQGETIDEYHALLDQYARFTAATVSP